MTQRSIDRFFGFVRSTIQHPLLKSRNAGKIGKAKLSVRYRRRALNGTTWLVSTFAEAELIQKSGRLGKSANRHIAVVTKATAHCAQARTHAREKTHAPAFDVQQAGERMRTFTKTGLILKLVAETCIETTTILKS